MHLQSTVNQKNTPKIRESYCMGMYVVYAPKIANASLKLKAKFAKALIIQSVIKPKS